MKRTLMKKAPRRNPGGRPSFPTTQTADDAKTALIVVGMHRSGTSALTRVISMLGADLPSNLLPPAENGNPTGFWESTEINNETELLLNGLQQDWMTLHSLPAGWTASPAAAHYSMRLGEIIRKDFEHSNLIVLKDPRFCRVLPLVAKTVQDCGYLPKIILCVRHPSEVSASLHRRQEFPPEKGLALWLRYVVDSERNSRHLPRCVVSYPELLTDWKGIAGRIAETLKIKFPVDPQDIVHDVDTFLCPDLCHHNQPKTTSPLHSFLRETHAAMQLLRHHPYSATAATSLERVNQYLEREEKLLLKVVYYETLWAKRLHAEVQEITQELGAAREANLSLGNSLGNLESESVKLRAEIEASLLSSKSVEIERQRESDRLKTEQQSIREGFQKQFELLHQECVKAWSETSHARSLLARLQEEHSAQKRTIASLAAEVLNLNQSQQSSKDRTDRLVSDLGNARAKTDEVQNARHRCLARLDGMVIHRTHEREATKRKIWSAAQSCRQALELPSEARLASILSQSLLYPVRLTEHEARIARSIQESGLFDPEHYSRIFTHRELQVPGDHLAHFVRYGLPLGLDPHPFFDCGYYIRTNRDIDFRTVTPFIHFLTIGAFEGRNPNPLFDVLYYFHVRNDVREEGLNPLVHYVRWGLDENQSPSPLFDPEYYAARYGNTDDVRRNPLAHYLVVGQHDNFQPNLLFDPQYYLSRHPEASESGMGLVEHYLAVGEPLGFKPHPLFDPTYYLEVNEDVRNSGLNGLAHYLGSGMAEGRSPNPFFDIAYYCASNPGAADFPGGPIQHYLTEGAANLRTPHPDFDLIFYHNSYPDLVDAKVELLGHFLDSGDFEGRRPNMWFDPCNYRELHPHVAEVDAAPFKHFLRHRDVQRLTSMTAEADHDSLQSLPWRHSGEAKRLFSPHFRILFISHIASRTGAPICILRLLEQLACRDDIECRVLVHEDGELTPLFSKLAPTLLMSDVAGTRDINQSIDVVARLFRNEAGRCVAVANTAACSAYAEAFNRHEVPVLSWLHELPTSIDTFLGGDSTVDAINRSARSILCPSQFVRDALTARYGLDARKFTVLHNGTELPPADIDREGLRISVRQELGLPSESRIVLGCGTVDMRKGVDLFVQTASKVDDSLAKDTWFVWVGNPYDDRFFGWLKHDIARLGVSDRIVFVGQREDPSSYFAAADVFLLTSREDPFPMVSMEALSYGLPVAAFRDAGGATEMYSPQKDRIVPYCDVQAMAQAVAELLRDLPAARARGLATAEMMAAEHSWGQYAENFLKLLNDRYGFRQTKELRVSVVVPCYEHSQYLAKRLDSILSQTRPPDEIIFIDDHSNDESVAIALQYAETSPIPFQVVVNDANSGTPFAQWLKGIELATCDLIWIAESDDYCTLDFLERIIPEFYDDEVRLAYAQSVPVDCDGNFCASDYLHYTDEISPVKWMHYYSVPGSIEIVQALSLKNTIPNASSVVVRRPIPGQGLDDLAGFRYLGDWWFYAHMAISGKLSYLPKALNFHRRHSTTVTSKSESKDIAFKEELQVKLSIFEGAALSRSEKCRSLVWSLNHYYSTSERFDLSRPSPLHIPAFTPLMKRLKDNILPLRPDRRLRVLTVLPDMCFGGSQTAGLRLAKAMSPFCESFIVNARPALCDAGFRELVDDSVILLEGTMDRLPWMFDTSESAQPNTLSENPRRIQLLRDLIEYYEIDAIISHGWWADRLTYSVNPEGKTPWIIRMHGCYEGLVDHPEWDSDFATICPEIMRLTSGIVYSTERNLRIFSESEIEQPPRIARLFNCFNPGEVPSTTTSSIHREPGDFIFCLCSRAIPEKGWKEAIMAIAEINSLPAGERGGRKARLLLIGGGDFANELANNHTMDEVTFCGQQARPVELIAQCDAGLLPSTFPSESLPSTIIEYLACGLPVVATDIGSIPDMIAANGFEAALLLKLEGRSRFDHTELTALMLRYITQPDLHAAHKANARAVFDAKFNADHVVSDYLDIIESLRS